MERVHWTNKYKTERETKLGKAPVNPSPLQNQKGMALVLTLSVMPLIIGVGLCISALMQITLWKSKAEYSCHKIHLNNQDQIRIGYQSLQKLNLGAKTLRYKRYLAYAKLAAAIASYNGPAIAKYTGQLNQVIARQHKYAKKQKFIEDRIKNMIQLMNLRTSKLLRSKLNVSARVSSEKYRFNLIRSPASSLTPDYITPENFSSVQETSSTWSLSLRQILPAWMNKFNLDIKFHQKIKGQCAVTQYQKEGRWYAGLSKGKF